MSHSTSDAPDIAPPSHFVLPRADALALPEVGEGEVLESQKPAPDAPSKAPHVAQSQLPLSNEIGATDAISALEAAPRAPFADPREQVKALVEKTLAARPQTDAELVERAYAFAEEKHRGVTRKTGEAYIEHPLAVARILAELGMDDIPLAAALLHDVPEDCNVSFEEMTERFGPEVAHLVEGVTKLKQIRFDTKADKQAENLRKLFLAIAGDVRVIIVKLADRLHNMRTLAPFNEAKRIEISDETLYIFAPIAHRLGIWRVKWELEDLAFKYLKPREYKQIYTLVQEKRSERTARVNDAIALLTEKLKADGIEAEVTGRPKHFYSIYQKMIKQGLNFEAIHDLTALRVITRSLPDCYHALGMAHAQWMQVPEMFFDYISKPKPNNYQSLHTKVIDGDGELLEIQIRTREMHREAEFGIAAHWRYKADAPTQKSFGDRLHWLRPVLELQIDTAGDAGGFLDSLKMDLAAEQVFVFTPRGDVVFLPINSSPVDFAFRVHSEIGAKCMGAKVNARIVPLSHKLHNGDICEIVTSNTSTGPKRGWLDFVVTPHAKARIKAFLRKQDFQENYRYGLQKLEKAARSERFKVTNIADNPVLKELAKEKSQKSAADVIAAIGYGEYSAESVVHRLQAASAPASAGATPETLSGTATTVLQKRVKTFEDASKPEAQEGDLAFGSVGAGAEPGETSPPEIVEVDPNATGDVAYQLARCCAPIPGDGVRGYVTRGRGISVHRADCSNLRHSEDREPNRIVAARWTSEPDKGFAALVAVEASDRSGLLADVTILIAARRINISGVNTYPLKGNRARLNIALSIRDSMELGELMSALRAVIGVIDVHRV